MITALATVVSVDTTEHGSRVELSCDQQTSCSHCASKNSCGTGIVSKAVGNKKHLWKLTTDKAVAVGQTVEIGISESNLVKYAFIVYLLPIFMLMLGAAVTEFFLAPSLGMGEGLIILVSAFSFVVGIAMAKAFSVKLKSASLQSVKLIRTLGDRVMTN